MSGVTAHHNRLDRNAHLKYSNSRTSEIYKGKPGPGPQRPPFNRYGLSGTGKMAPPARRIPRPAQLPSLKSENSGNDPRVFLVPVGGHGWGGKEAPTAAAAGHVAPPAAVPTSAASAPAPVAAAPAVPSAPRTWSGLSNQPVHQSPGFQREFPSLSGPSHKRTHAAAASAQALGAVDQPQQEPVAVRPAAAGDVATARPGAAPDGPSLRPTTAGSWARGGRRAEPTGPATTAASSAAPAPPATVPVLTGALVRSHTFGGVSSTLSLPPAFSDLMPAYMRPVSAATVGAAPLRVTPSKPDSDGSRAASATAPTGHTDSASSVCGTTGRPAQTGTAPVRGAANNSAAINFDISKMIPFSLPTTKGLPINVLASKVTAVSINVSAGKRAFGDKHYYSGPALERHSAGPSGSSRAPPAYATYPRGFGGWGTAERSRQGDWNSAERPPSDHVRRGPSEEPLRSTERNPLDTRRSMERSPAPPARPVEKSPPQSTKPTGHDQPDQREPAQRPPAYTTAERDQPAASQPAEQPPAAPSLQPIIRDEDLRRFDDTTQLDKGWAAGADEIDYNKKLSFSDDETEPEPRSLPQGAPGKARPVSAAVPIPRQAKNTVDRPASIQLSPSGRSAWVTAGRSVAEPGHEPDRRAPAPLRDPRRHGPPPSQPPAQPPSWRGAAARHTNGAPPPPPEPEPESSGDESGGYSASWADEVTPVTAPVLRERHLSQNGLTEVEPRGVAAKRDSQERSPSWPEAEERPRRHGADDVSPVQRNPPDQGVSGGGSPPRRDASRWRADPRDVRRTSRQQPPTPRWRREQQQQRQWSGDGTQYPAREEPERHRPVHPDQRYRQMEEAYGRQRPVMDKAGHRVHPAEGGYQRSPPTSRRSTETNQYRQQTAENGRYRAATDGQRYRSSEPVKIEHHRPTGGANDGRYRDSGPMDNMHHRSSYSNENEQSSSAEHREGEAFRSETSRDGNNSGSYARSPRSVDGRSVDRHRDAFGVEGGRCEPVRAGSAAPTQQERFRGSSTSDDDPYEASSSSEDRYGKLPHKEPGMYQQTSAPHTDTLMPQGDNYDARPMQIATGDCQSILQEAETDQFRAAAAQRTGRFIRGAAPMEYNPRQSPLTDDGRYQSSPPLNDRHAEHTVQDREPFRAPSSTERDYGTLHIDDSDHRSTRRSENDSGRQLRASDGDCDRPFSQYNRPSTPPESHRNEGDSRYGNALLSSKQDYGLSTSDNARGRDMALLYNSQHPPAEREPTRHASGSFHDDQPQSRGPPLEAERWNMSGPVEGSEMSVTDGRQRDQWPGAEVNAREPSATERPRARPASLADDSKYRPGRGADGQMFQRHSAAENDWCRSSEALQVGEAQNSQHHRAPSDVTMGQYTGMENNRYIIRDTNTSAKTEGNEQYLSRPEPERQMHSPLSGIGDGTKPSAKNFDQRSPHSADHQYKLKSNEAGRMRGSLGSADSDSLRQLESLSDCATPELADDTNTQQVTGSTHLEVRQPQRWSARDELALVRTAERLERSAAAQTVSEQELNMAATSDGQPIAEDLAPPDDAADGSEGTGRTTHAHGKHADDRRQRRDERLTRRPSAEPPTTRNKQYERVPRQHKLPPRLARQREAGWPPPPTAGLFGAPTAPVASGWPSCPVSSADPAAPPLLRSASNEAAAEAGRSSLGYIAPFEGFDDANVPAQTIIFENTNFKNSRSQQQQQNRPAGSPAPLQPVAAPSPPASTAETRQFTPEPRTSDRRPPLELPMMFESDAPARQLQLDFTFDQELAVTLGGARGPPPAPHRPPPVTIATSSGGGSGVPISRVTADLNRKIASVKKVWDVPVPRREEPASNSGGDSAAGGVPDTTDAGALGWETDKSAPPSASVGGGDALFFSPSPAASDSDHSVRHAQQQQPPAAAAAPSPPSHSHSLPPPREPNRRHFSPYPPPPPPPAAEPLAHYPYPDGSRPLGAGAKLEPPSALYPPPLQYIPYGAASLLGGSALLGHQLLHSQHPGGLFNPPPPPPPAAYFQGGGALQPEPHLAAFGLTAFGAPAAGSRSPVSSSGGAASPAPAPQQSRPPPPLPGQTAPPQSPIRRPATIGRSPALHQQPPVGRMMPTSAAVSQPLVTLAPPTQPLPTMVPPAAVGAEQRQPRLMALRHQEHAAAAAALQTAHALFTPPASGAVGAAHSAGVMETLPASADGVHMSYEEMGHRASRPRRPRRDPPPPTR